MKILGNDLSESPVGKLFTTVKKLINPYANENEDYLTRNKNHRSDENDKPSSKYETPRKTCQNNESSTLKRKANQVRRPKGYVAGISYESDSSEEQDEEPRTIKKPTYSENLIVSDEEAKSSQSPIKEKEDSVSTVSMNSMKAEVLYKQAKNSDNEVTTSTSSSSEEDIDFSPDGSRVIKKREKKIIISSSSSSPVINTPESLDFLSADDENLNKGCEIQTELVKNSDMQQNQSENHMPSKNVVNNEKIHVNNADTGEPSNKDADNNSKQNSTGGEKKRSRKNSSLVSRKKKIKRLLNKKKKLTPCVIIDIIRNKKHPLNKVEHLFTHNTIKALSKKELNLLKRVIIKYKQQNIKKR